VLATDAGYVSLVASRRRAGVIVERLRHRGVSADRLSRLHAPAGLDIGAATPAEIAVSILAEIIQHHRTAKPAEPEEVLVSAAVPTAATDPICGMLVEIATARHRSEFEGRAVYFCCRPCKDRFDEAPERYRTALH
jgi:xanthine dehydrogenase accessory factor